MLLLGVSPVRVLASTNTKKNMADMDGYLEPSKAILIPKAADSCRSAVKFFQDRYGVDLFFRDMFRSAEDQAKIRKAKGQYAALPGFSGHNFGISMDLHINRIFAQFRCAQKSYSLKKLRGDLRGFGWTHRESAMWHFDFLDGNSTVEDAIPSVFKQAWDTQLPISDVAHILTILGYKNPEVMNTTILETNLANFQKSYGLEATGKMSKITRRALLTASMKIHLI